MPRYETNRLVSSCRFAATDGYGDLAHAHVFHAHRCIPFEHLLVGVLGLILRRIPVEGVEHAGFRIFLAVHGKYVMNDARGGTAYQGHALQDLLQIVEERDRNFQNAVQGLGLHLVSIAAPDIAEAVPLVVSAVEPDDEETTGLQKFIQGFDGGFAIRRVVEHADAIDDVETFGSKRHGNSEQRREADKITIASLDRKR